MKNSFWNNPLNKNLLVIAIALMPQIVTAQQINGQSTAANIAERIKFQDNKFGMFIHWGVYSLLADGEWVMFQKKIPYKQYSLLPNSFYPHDFNANEWVKVAKAAGMKYITVTARHHDGFSMYPTKESSYNIMDATPFKKDPLAELARACKEQGIVLNFYYSLLDWGRDDYGFRKKITGGKPENTDWDSYIRFMKAQLTELLTNYGPIGCIWFDGYWDRKEVNWHYEEIYTLIHKLQPGCLIGNNHHMNPLPGEDFQMFEKDLPGKDSHGFGTGGLSTLPLETCETMNNNWGYNISDTNYKSTPALIRYLIKAAGNNANFLLNIGPMADGKIPQPVVDSLRKIGEWLQEYGETIYNTRTGFMSQNEWGASTSKGPVNYLHILKIPNEEYLFIPAVAKKIKTITDFKTGKAIRYKQVPEGLIIYAEELDQSLVDNVAVITFK